MGYPEGPTDPFSLSTPAYYYSRLTLKLFRGEPAICEIG